MNIDIEKISKEIHIAPETYVSIVKAAFVQADEDMAELKKALEEKNADKIRFIAHRTGGSFSNLRISLIAEAVLDLHAEVKGSFDENKCKEMVREIEKNMASVKEFFSGK